MRLLSRWNLCEGHWKKSPLNFSHFLTTVLGEYTERCSSVGDELVSDEYITPYWNVCIMSFFFPAANDLDFSKSNGACSYTRTVHQFANQTSCLLLKPKNIYMIINQIWDIGTLLVLISAKQKGCIHPDAIELSFSIWHVLPLSCCWHRDQTHCFMEMCKSYQSNLAKLIQKSSQC